MAVMPPLPRVTLGRLLEAAQFSPRFIRHLGRWRKQPGFVLTIDDPNVLMLVTKDFLTHARGCQAVLATNMPLAYLAAENEDNDVLFEDLLLKDLRTRMVGPGFHQHDERPEVALCCESVEPAATSQNQTGLSKYLNRFALVSLTSMECLTGYVKALEQRALGPQTLRRFICRDGNSWSRDAIAVRKSNTLFLDTLWQDVLDDATDFLSEATRTVYVKHGIPYVRSYLFYGPPGNGKTSCIKALASELQLNLYSLNLASSKLDDNGLVDMVHSVMKRSIVALEDVDRIFNNHTQNDSASSVSFSTVINVLDGILSKDGVIFVLTCNHKDQLDDALRRCGRVHREFEFKDATANTAQALFLSFYPDATQSARTFAQRVRKEKTLPVAALQDFLLKHHKRSADEAALIAFDDSLLARRRRVELSVV